MDIDQAAAHVRDELLDEVDDDLLAVGWYHGHRDERTDTVYVDDSYAERATEVPEDTGGVLENLMLESLGHGIHEEAHGEELVANVRCYETIVDIDFNVDTYQGVVVALQADGEYQIREIIDVIDGAV